MTHLDLFRAITQFRTAKGSIISHSPELEEIHWLLHR
jgi:hypothetical protein